MFGMELNVARRYHANEARAKSAIFWVMLACIVLEMLQKLYALVLSHRVEDSSSALR